MIKRRQSVAGRRRRGGAKCLISPRMAAVARIQANGMAQRGSSIKRGGVATLGGTWYRCDVTRGRRYLPGVWRPAATST